MDALAKKAGDGHSVKLRSDFAPRIDGYTEVRSLNYDISSIKERLQVVSVISEKFICIEDE